MEKAEREDGLDAKEKSTDVDVDKLSAAVEKMGLAVREALEKEEEAWEAETERIASRGSPKGEAEQSLESADVDIKEKEKL